MHYKYVEVPASVLLKQEHLLQEYSKESKSSLVPTINPDYTMYTKLESLGMLNCIATVSNNSIVGFIVLLTTVMPHYSQLSTTVESFFVHKDHRKFGTGKRLIDMAETIAKSKGSSVMFMSAPEGSRLEKATKLFGFKQTHKLYIKSL